MNLIYILWQVIYKIGVEWGGFQRDLRSLWRLLLRRRIGDGKVGGEGQLFFFFIEYRIGNGILVKIQGEVIFSVEDLGIFYICLEVVIVSISNVCLNVDLLVFCILFR